MICKTKRKHRAQTRWTRLEADDENLDEQSLVSVVAQDEGDIERQAPYRDEPTNPDIDDDDDDFFDADAENSSTHDQDELDRL